MTNSYSKLYSILLAWLIPLAVQHAHAEQSVSGEAYGVFADTLLGSRDRAPVAVVDADEGVVTSELAKVDVSGVVTAESLDSGAAGSLGENAASTQTRSTLQNVNILDGVVKADLVVGMASTAANGAKAPGNAAGSTFAGLVVNGTSLPDQVDPNTRVVVPGVGDVILNEQIVSGDGIENGKLTVNMIHVLIKDSLTGETTGEIITGSATSATSVVK